MCVAPVSESIDSVPTQELQKFRGKKFSAASRASLISQHKPVGTSYLVSTDLTNTVYLVWTKPWLTLCTCGNGYLSLGRHRSHKQCLQYTHLWVQIVLESIFKGFQHVLDKYIASSIVLSKINLNSTLGILYLFLLPWIKLLIVLLPFGDSIGEIVPLAVLLSVHYIDIYGYWYIYSYQVW